MEIKLNEKKELVVNWHITEACNYKCYYCFAKWGKQKNEILNNDQSITKLMNEIEMLPDILNELYATKFDKIRLNLVGGEVFLNTRKVAKVIRHAKQRKFNLSAITNGSRLNEELIKLVADNFDSIGFSIDSLNEKTNIEAGRVEKNKSMDIGKVLEDISSIRDLNSSIDIKINTVVSILNKSEDLSGFIDKVEPNKWKVFKVLPVKTSQYNISESDFLKFLDRHKEFKNIISSEDNDEMTDSYLMIDPIGMFFQNSSFGEEYYYSQPIIEVGINKAIKEIRFNAQKFFERYEKKRISLLETL